ncbi:hypothetical protein KKC32_01100 [Patescibacteria group bacterium]|nr:hypothetical protein [Patescibacteria group bacterium]
MKRLIYTATIIFILLANFSAIAPARAAEVSFSLSPDYHSYILNHSFSVNVLIDTAGIDTDAADAILYYDPTYLEVVDVMSGIPGTQVLPGSVYSVYPGNDVDASTGRIRITGFSLTPYNSGAGTGVFATITFIGRQATDDTAVTFEFNPGDSHDSNIAETGTSDDILAAVHDGHYLIGPDIAPPFVTNLNPADNATGVSPTTNVSFHIKDIDSAVDLNSVKVVVAGVEYTLAGANRFGYSGSANDYLITIDPAAIFDYEQIVNVSIDGKDTAGNAMPTVNSKFTIAKKPENQAPKFSFIGGKTVYAGNKLLFAVIATDPNPGDILTITMENAPSGAELTQTDNGRALFSWQTSLDDLGKIENIDFHVRDNGDPQKTDSTAVKVSVLEPVVEIPFECPPCPPCGQRTECSNRIDDDSDGLIDYPNDPSCQDYYDNDEWSSQARIMSPLKSLSKIVERIYSQAKFVAPAFADFLRISGAGDNASFSLSPSSGIYSPGQIFNVNILVNTDNAETDAADVILHYDPVYLEVVDALPAAGIQVLPGSLYESYPGNIVDPVNGTIKVTGFSFMSTYRGSNGIFATVNFRAKQNVAGTPVTFEFTLGSTTDSNLALHGTSDDILSSVNGGNYSIQPNTKPPYVANFSPARGAANVQVNANVSFNLKDDETGVDINSVKVKVNGLEYSSNIAPKFTFSGSVKNYGISLTPQNMDYDKRFDISVDAKDTENNIMTTYDSWFQTMSVPTNSAPQLDHVSEKSGYIDSEITFTVRAHDADVNDKLTFSLIGALPGSSLDQIDNNTAVFSWKPTLAGDYTTKIRVTDNGDPALFDEQTISIRALAPTEEPLPVVCPLCPVCSECSDGIDNDNNGKIDFPADPGCDSESDNSESTPAIVLPPVLPPELPPGVLPEVPPEVPLIPPAEEIIGALAENIQKVKTLTLDNPTVEKVNETAVVPLAVIAFAASVIAVATARLAGIAGVSALTYLLFILSQLFIFFGWKHRRRGIVYDSITKKPVYLARVRLYESTEKKLIKTCITDKNGRYGFRAAAGKYFVVVDKKDYHFPSLLLEYVDADGEYKEIYYGTEFEVSDKRIDIIMPIPIDPDMVSAPSKSVIRINMLSKTEYVLTIFGPILSILSYLINPVWWIGIIALIQIALFVLFRKITLREKQKNWGIVKDSVSGKCLKNAIVRLFDKKSNQLIAARITDRKGRYSGLPVGARDYYLTVEKEGYDNLITELVHPAHADIKSGLMTLELQLPRNSLAR